MSGSDQGSRAPEAGHLYEAFRVALDRAGLTLDTLSNDPSRAGALYRVAEALVDSRRDSGC